MAEDTLESDQTATQIARENAAEIRENESEVRKQAREVRQQQAEVARKIQLEHKRIQQNIAMKQTRDWRIRHQDLMTQFRTNTGLFENYAWSPLEKFLFEVLNDLPVTSRNTTFTTQETRDHRGVLTRKYLTLDRPVTIDYTYHLGGLFHPKYPERPTAAERERFHQQLSDLNIALGTYVDYRPAFSTAGRTQAPDLKVYETAAETHFRENFFPLYKQYAHHLALSVPEWIAGNRRMHEIFFGFPHTSRVVVTAIDIRYQPGEFIPYGEDDHIDYAHSPADNDREWFAGHTERPLVVDFLAQMDDHFYRANQEIGAGTVRVGQIVIYPREIILKDRAVLQRIISPYSYNIDDHDYLSRQPFDGGYQVIRRLTEADHEVLNFTNCVW